jgi:nondiscriminating aspartyl-tRNA synthetase
MDVNNHHERNIIQKDEDNRMVIYSDEMIKGFSKRYMEREKPKATRVLCKDLPDFIQQDVEIQGWIHMIYDLGGIRFYILRDRSGLTQLVMEDPEEDVDISLETVVTVYGRVTTEERSPYQHIEIKTKKITIVSRAHSGLPITINSHHTNLNLPTILDNRPLSIRNLRTRSVFTIQSEIIRLFNEYMRENSFTEIKSPKIISTGTEGGTNIFELTYFDRPAFLAQSPQFYKQMMVGSGFERVFEIGPVFRAEKHDTIRHLNEYTSMDFEMGFIRDEQDIIDMQEGFILHMVRTIKEKYPSILEEFNSQILIPERIPRVHFLEALKIADSYGVKDMDGDISPEGERVLCTHVEKETGSSFVYIIGYPISKRPMYTMPDDACPGYTRSFDLLFKGLEVTTGGMRIHGYKMLWNNIKKFGCNPHEFSTYLQAFKFGMPPHGGLGMGLERLTMQMLSLKNIREATLFPRDRNRITP